MFRYSPQADPQHTQQLLSKAIHTYFPVGNPLCHPSSSCHVHWYIPSRVQLTNPQACQALLSGLKDTYVYRYAEDFCRVCITCHNRAYCNINVTLIVSWHLLGRELQPYLRDKADSFFYPSIQYGSDTCCYLQAVYTCSCILYRMRTWIVLILVNIG